MTLDPNPTCPVCGQRDGVQRERHSHGSFLCGHCWTLFDGNEDEWHRFRKTREAWAGTYERLRERNWKSEPRPSREVRYDGVSA